MRKTVYLLICIVFFSSCAARKIGNNEARLNNERIQKENSVAIALYKNFTPYQYIERFKAVAIQEMNLYGIPASITLAQGLFESGNGNSELARVANNHFGIKATVSWKGRIYYKDDDGNPYSEKKVSWTVSKEDEPVAKGKGETDKNGFISVSFINTKNVGLDSATIVTVLDNGSRKQFTSTFPLKSIAGPDDIRFLLKADN